MIDGRIIKGIGGLYYVDTKIGFYKCSVRGIFRKEKNIPIVGDFVKLKIIDKNNSIGIVYGIKERKNEFKRPKVANIDQVIIVFACKNPNINIDLLDRFIVLSEEKNLKVIICINKIDMDERSKYQDIKSLYDKIGYRVLFTSIKNKIGIEDLNIILKDKVSLFAGPSGVGKSSLINLIVPKINREVGEISKKIKKGKHTTRHAQLIELKDGGYIIDTPGFTTLFFDHIDKNELQYYFKEFRGFIGRCKFNDCNHIDEPNCIIKDSIDKSNITKRRYDRYRSFFHELN